MALARSFLALLVVFFASISQAAIENLFEVSPTIYRGSQPNEAADYQALKRLGIKTIVSLRNDGAFEEPIAKQFGFKFILFPMNAWTYPDDQMVDQALASLRDPENGKIFVHCWRGKDRTGLIVALHRVFVQGWDPKAAYDEWVAFGFWKGFVQYRHYYHRKTKALRSQTSHTLIPQADLVVAGN